MAKSVFSSINIDDKTCWYIESRIKKFYYEREKVNKKLDFDYEDLIQDIVLLLLLRKDDLKKQSNNNEHYNNLIIQNVIWYLKDLSKKNYKLANKKVEATESQLNDAIEVFNNVDYENKDLLDYIYSFLNKDEIKLLEDVVFRKKTFRQIGKKLGVCPQTALNYYKKVKIKVKQIFRDEYK